MNTLKQILPSVPLNCTLPKTALKLTANLCCSVDAVIFLEITNLSYKHEQR